LAEGFQRRRLKCEKSMTAKNSKGSRRTAKNSKGLRKIAKNSKGLRRIAKNSKGLRRTTKNSKVLLRPYESGIDNRSRFWLSFLGLMSQA
jgi:hypothetical protein